MRTKRGRYGSTTPSSSPVLYILHGIGMSVLATLFFSLFLSLASMVIETVYLDVHLPYVIVGVTVTSIFIGSVYATQKAGNHGLMIGVAIGAVYVFLAVALGMKLSGETITLAMFANKFIAGVAAGALGGTIGVNL